MFRFEGPRFNVQNSKFNVQRSGFEVQGAKLASYLAPKAQPASAKAESVEGGDNGLRWRRLSHYIADATMPLNHCGAIHELLPQNAVATEHLYSVQSL
jgi:hypothetical protein